MFYTARCDRGGIGIRAALRMLWRNPWGFKSPRSHHEFSLLRAKRTIKKIQCLGVAITFNKDFLSPFIIFSSKLKTSEDGQNIFSLLRAKRSSNLTCPKGAHPTTVITRLDGNYNSPRLLKYDRFFYLLDFRLFDFL